MHLRETEREREIKRGVEGRDRDREGRGRERETVPLQQQLDELGVALVGGDGERGVAGRGHGRRVDVGALVQQHAAHLHVAAARRLHERRQASLSAVLDVRFAVEQQAHHLVSSCTKPSFSDYFTHTALHSTLDRYHKAKV